jgi:hypothetical protein
MSCFNMIFHHDGQPVHHPPHQAGNGLGLGMTRSAAPLKPGNVEYSVGVGVKETDENTCADLKEIGIGISRRRQESHDAFKTPESMGFDTPLGGMVV